VLIGLQGRGVIRIHGEHEFVLQANQAVVVMPEASFEYHGFDKSWEVASICFECSIPLLLQFRLKPNKPFMLNSLTRILELVHLLHSCIKEEHDHSWKSSEMVYSLLAELKLQNLSVQSNSSYPEVTIQKITEYIHSHFSSKLNLEEISKSFGYTAQHLNKLFKCQLGYSIYQYILKVQLEHAAEILETEDLTVEQVADRVGMEPRSFYRLFHKKYQIAPGAFRKVMKALKAESIVRSAIALMGCLGVVAASI
jgi:AraC-like DNA-binding protein